MNNKKRKNQTKRQKKLHARSAHTGFSHAKTPMLCDLPIRYEKADRVRVLSVGGIGAIHTMIQKLNLPALINEQVTVLKRHLPYFESDHILSLCYSVLCGHKPLQDLNRLRTDAVYLDALGQDKLPAPSTTGDFLRRFKQQDILALQEAINQARVKVWQRQPQAFFKAAIIDMDGTVFSTDAQCTQGVDYCAYKRMWGYAPLLISLAGTCEPLYVVNRPGSVASHEGIAFWVARALKVVQPHFQSVCLRGDTDFSLTQHFDGWTQQGVQFIFGYNAMKNLIHKAEELPLVAWTPLKRHKAYDVKTKPRQKPKNIKRERIKKRGYKHITCLKEHVADFAYQPVKCEKTYRIIALKKHLQISQNNQKIDLETRYFFYITNDFQTPPCQLVRFINQR